jgi:FKBP-type peptidyl-prolyl cis-trans isomerase
LAGQVTVSASIQKVLHMLLCALFVSGLAAAAIQVTPDGGVKKEILVEGKGAQPSRGQKVEVHYTGKLTDGKVFDSSVTRGTPFSFTIGQGVIQGWSIGVATMKVGEKSVFTLTPDYAYGAQGHPPVIPAKATLIFEIELLRIL